MSEELRRALQDELTGWKPAALAPVVERLSTRYREGGAASEPILRTPADVGAYAAYRMPATYAALRRVLGEAAAQRPDLAPRTLLDVGGGTGAALWAAVETWPGLTSLTVLEQAEQARVLGARLVAGAAHPALRSARWVRGVLGPATTLPAADVATLSYVLGELPEPLRDEVVDELGRAADTVVVVEPGTPAGYRRVLAARDRLIASGRSVAAPCPHEAACPLAGADWCHFSARVARTALHRQVKSATLGHEDEKFAYVVATRVPGPHAANRVLRHPVRRKGMARLRLCAGDGTAVDRVVSKRDPDAYRAARDVEWGDPWP
ncbi:small ribosomal subunit Rsm22 family protein [Saccharothrix australiensis]|uniref:Ribosomal protein RSM22 (Predicted rRNA methylase) n=1 Tax=Saccharothrix australiensis TaxID=2072 RepID=A0A495W3A6_9PSEU|nr:small ribosomal subunit Rsm22 family protein [Saccharothrix australiensis]RKT55245.1 ribosomal protein RSM22 (predicted rRNA methylase) [Saccharothrix australiensis]